MYSRKVKHSYFPGISWFRYWKPKRKTIRSDGTLKGFLRSYYKRVSVIQKMNGRLKRMQENAIQEAEKCITERDIISWMDLWIRN